MNDDTEISTHIPYLRRFARALTGAQESGDALVLSALEAAMADPAALGAGPNRRVALYRAFLKAWEAKGGASAAMPKDLTADERGAQQTLGLLAMRPRIVFLLSALENFDSRDIAAIMDMPRVDIEAMLEAAGRDIAQQLRTEALIIEDEPFIALDLKGILEELGHRVIGIARTYTDALKAVEGRQPGLILADIQLADGSSGLDAVNRILTGLSIPVIFVTAYPERYLTGKPPEPAFLITKPFGHESLKAVISQALFFGRRSRPAEPASV